MTQIKFRAWTEGDRILTRPFDIKDPDDASSIRYYALGDFSVLEQYSGLKDKNGVEIYEGDLMSYKLNGSDRVDFVRFVNGAFGIIGPSPMHDDLPLFDALTCVHDAVVVGNIHERGKA